jgi:hypothetical protein
MKEMSLQRKILFSFFLVIAGYIILEIFSFGFYCLAKKQIFSFSRTINFAKQISQSNIISSLDAAKPVILHPYLGYVYNPETNSDAYTDYHKHPISQYGFIDDAPPFHVRASNKLIIGIWGGSVAYFFSVYGTDMLISELKKFPRFSDREIVVVRVALGGYKQPQQLLALNYLLALGAEFDIIINLDGFNEVALPPAENVPKHVFPFYPRNWSMIANNTYDSNMLSFMNKINQLRSERIKWATSFSNRLYHYSVTLNIVWRAYDRYLSSELVQNQIALQKYRPNRQETPYVVTGASTHYLNENEMYTDLARVWKNCSLQMHRLCTANNIKYFHFLQPNQYVPDSKIMGEEELKQSFLVNHPYRAGVVKGYPLLRTISTELTKNEVNFYDLSMVFADNDEILYMDQCCHFHQRGNDLLGKIIGKSIVDSFKDEK